jgi:hypothetical protein
MKTKLGMAKWEWYNFTLIEIISALFVFFSGMQSSSMVYNSAGELYHSPTEGIFGGLFLAISIVLLFRFLGKFSSGNLGDWLPKKDKPAKDITPTNIVKPIKF